MTEQPAKQSQILIVCNESHRSSCENITEKLSRVGHNCQAMIGESSFKTIRNIEAGAIIIITDFSEEDVNQIKTKMSNDEKPYDNIPIIFFSSKDDFSARILAAKLGCSAFVSTHDDKTLLLDTLEQLLSDSQIKHHVLIIDDDVELAEYYSLIFQQHGIHTSIAHTSEAAFETLSNSTVDLILLDYYLPDCDGVTFAKVIRQMNEFVCLPIVFLSSKNTLKKIIDHNDIGADDCLVKPISPSTLIDTVTARIERANDLKQFMVRDHATGLLNHVTFKKELELEISRSTRRKSNFSYALLDLDHFKRVNDNYGHRAGDVALKFFAHVLKNRLRHTDIVSRYGGEEFAVIFLDSSAENAKKVLEEILATLLSTELEVDGHEFIISFSCGLVEFKDYPEVNALTKAGDDALYQAKNSGRKQIVVAPKTQLAALNQPGQQNAQ